MKEKYSGKKRLFSPDGFGHTEIMKIIVLGSGTSHGVPVIGCGCPVCTSDDPGDKRMRSSIYIEGPGGECVVIDTGPEFRLQALRAGIRRLDAIFLTHAHADHIHGLDDVRALSWNKPIPIYGNEQTIVEMEERFSYVWRETQEGGGKPRLLPRVISGPVCVGGLTFTPVPVKHGILDILGWKIEEGAGKSFLYLTDTSAIPSASFRQLNYEVSPPIRIIIIGGLRERPHETHFSFEQALNVALELGAEKTYLTHICHEHSHREIDEFCRKFIEKLQAPDQKSNSMECHPAYDGLELTL